MLLLAARKATSRIGAQLWPYKLDHLFVSVQAVSVVGESEGTAEVLRLLLRLLPC